ncbi:MAG TPA: malto-oligosyltrehalose synthase, partial [Myxococcota bacterium]
MSASTVSTVSTDSTTSARIASYRLQLHQHFTFDDATRIVPDLARLGVSHLYLSPILQAAPGTTHGYDVVDHTRIDTALGGRDGFNRLSDEATKHGLGIVVDIVPNHMCISDRDNVWWKDVLENGPASPWADFFDVDWQPPEEKNRNTVLLPILGDHRGAMLERGEIKVDRDGGRFFIRAHDHEVPVAPRTIGDILKDAASAAVVVDPNDNEDAPPLLAFLADCWRQLPPPELADPKLRRRRHRDKLALAALTTRLLDEDAAAAIAVDAAIARLNGDVDRLDAFLDQQNHRLAFWRTGARELDYRRFFDITSLAGLRVEDPRVFQETHALIKTLIDEGRIHGLRVDHVDGLADPAQYLQRLRALAPSAWIVVEKILGPGEQLPSSWPVDGTTGYDFLNDVLHCFVDPRAKDDLDGLYAALTHSWGPFADVAADKRHLVLRDVLAADVERCTQALVELSTAARRFRDLGRHDLRAALRALIVAFPVYRSYVAPTTTAVVDDIDRERLTTALALAQSREGNVDPLCFELIRSALLDDHRSEAALRFVTRFQQLTGPAMAKGVEDTAFYAWSRFIALNEVGGEPDVIDLHPAPTAALESFHAKNIDSAQRWPQRMLATSTHDTKRSEDVRARLAVLSERSSWWADAVMRFVGHHSDKHKSNVRCAAAPDGDLELALYQTMVGAWPLPVERCQQWALKAAREAKVCTSWTRPNEDYERGVREFIDAVYADAAFIADLEGVVAELDVVGEITALAQQVLKLTSPGVPDLYQGTELFSLDLVDPDNRRPVDDERRRRLLSSATDLVPSSWRAFSSLDAGMPKLLVTQRVLAARRRHLHSFGATSRYTPLFAADVDRESVVAFDREAVVVVVPARAQTLFAGSSRSSLLCS